MPSGYQSYPSNNNTTNGYKILTPFPLDAHMGPWEATSSGSTAGTTTGGVVLANSILPPGIRYQGQKVIILANTNPGQVGGITQAYIYWYRGGTANSDLVEFSSGAASSGSDFPTGISAAGATFTGLVRVYAGISVNGSAVFGSTITGTASNSLALGATAASGWAQLAPTNTFASLNTFSAGISAAGATYTGQVRVYAGISVNGNAVFGSTITGTASNSLALGATAASGWAQLAPTNTFASLNTFSAGISAAGATFTALAAAYSGISVNGSATFGGSVTATTFTGNLSGNASTATSATSATTATTATTATNSTQLGGVAASSYARNDQANTFAGLQSFSAGISAAGATLTGLVAAYAGISVNGSAAFGGSVTATTFTGNLSGNASTATSATSATNSTQLGGVAASSYARNDQANTFAGLQTFSAGISAAGATFTALVAAYSGISVNGSAAFGGSVTATTFTGNLSGNASTATSATSATTATNSTQLGGVAASSYARNDQANTFAGLQSFSAGISAAGATFTGLVAAYSGISVNGNAVFGGSITGTASNALALGATAASGWAQLAAINTFSAANTFNGAVTIGNTLTVNGNFFVEGTVTTVNRADLEIDDKIIVLGRTLDSNANLSFINGSGLWIGLSGAGQEANHTYYLLYQTGSDAWESGRDFNVRAGRGYKINGVTAIGSPYAAGACGGVLYRNSTGQIDATAIGTANQILRSTGTNSGPDWINTTALTGITAERVKINTSPANNTFHLTMVLNNSAGAQEVFVDSGITFDTQRNILSCTQIEAMVDGGTW